MKMFPTDKKMRSEMAAFFKYQRRDAELLRLLLNRKDWRLIRIKMRAAFASGYLAKS